MDLLTIHFDAITRKPFVSFEKIKEKLKFNLISIKSLAFLIFSKTRFQGHTRTSIILFVIIQKHEISNSPSKISKTVITKKTMEMNKKKKLFLGTHNSNKNCTNLNHLEIINLLLL